MAADVGPAPVLVKNIMNHRKKYSTVLFQNKNRSPDEKRRTTKTHSARSEKHAGIFSPGDAFSQNHGRSAARRRGRRPGLPESSQNAPALRRCGLFLRMPASATLPPLRQTPRRCLICNASSPALPRPRRFPAAALPAPEARLAPFRSLRFSRPPTLRRLAPCLFRREHPLLPLRLALSKSLDALPSPTAQKQRRPASASS